MAFRKEREESKILDVDASMQGTLVFKDKVNLRINGNFEGRLDTKGTLTIGEKASVRADIVGEEIIVSGQVTGNITAQKQLKVLPTARIVGDIITPLLSVESGAILQGRCQMLTATSLSQGNIFNIEELARYLGVGVDNIMEWVNSGKIPAFKEGDNWRFERAKIEEWVAKERIR